MSNIRILIVEDEASIRNMYAFKLESTNYDVRTAINGKDGLLISEEWLPHLILLDLRMPILSGDKMLQQLRDTEWGATIRVILLTNISKSEAPTSLRFLNVDRYVVKAHTTPNELMKIIDEVLH